MKVCRSFPGRWPLWLLIAGLLLILLFRVGGGLALDSFVAWGAKRRPADWQLLEGLILGSPVLFGRAALPALERIHHERPRFRFESYVAIARLSPGRARRLLDGRATTPPSERSWWRPPEPSAELLDALRGRLEPRPADTPEASLGARLERQLQRSCILRREDGSTLVVFSHSLLGGVTDLWLFRPGEPASEAAFIGAQLGSRQHHSDYVLRCSLLEGDTLELVWSYADDGYRPARPPPSPALVWLPELIADGDEDGLTERVERRLFTDPLARDTDGDGLDDREDPSPNGGPVPAPDSIDAAIHELLRTLSLLADRPCGWGAVLYLVSDRRPERWSSGCGPTINLPPSEVERLPAGIDVLVIEPYNDRWGRFGSMSIAPGSLGSLIEAATRPDATRLLLVNDHLGSDSEGYEVQLRRQNGRWQMIWFKNLWI